MRTVGFVPAAVFLVLASATGHPIAVAEPAPGQDQPAARERPVVVRATAPPRQVKPAPVKVRAKPIVVAAKRTAPPKVNKPHPRPGTAPVQVTRKPAPQADVAATPAAAEPQRFLEPNPAVLRRGTRRDEVIVPLPQSDAQVQAPVGPPAPPMVAPQGPSLPAGMQPAPAAEPRAPSAPPPVSAEPNPSALNVIRTAPEQIGQMPSQFLWIRDGLMAARDPLDNTLVFFNNEGRVVGRAKFPEGFDTQDIIGQPTAIRLIDFSHRTQVTIQRNVDPATFKVLQATPNSSDSTVRAARLTRRGPHELVVNDERQNGTHPLTVRSVAGGQLAQAYEVSTGSGGNRYVVTEEITAVKPALTVRVVVQRFDKAGKLSGVVYVPLNNFEQVIRNFIAITGNGQARVLRPTVEGVKVDEYDFAAPPRGGNRRLNDSELRSLSRKLREIAVDTTVQGDNSTPFNDGGEHLQLDIAAPPIARATVLTNARAYLTINWVMQRENFERSGIENRCDPGRSYVWLRPRNFTRDMIGTTIGPMPYRWGGEDTPATFRTRIEWGALAGDLCTCRQAQYNYCIFADSAGVDCSGFVSRAWGIEKRGTSGLLDVATDLDSLADLKPGDAFDWPQRHIRLFTGMAEGAATAFVVLESSTRYQCQGVCERTYRPSELNGYRLIRYKGISDTAVVATNGQTGEAKPTEANGGAKPNGTAAPSADQNGTATAPQSGEPAANAAAAVKSRATAKKHATVKSRTAVQKRTAAPSRRPARSVHVNSGGTQWR